MSSMKQGAKETHALIIGINDYDGGADLEGGVPDARGWVHIALEMGLDPSNITVLTRPVLDASHWPDDPRAAKIRFGDATQEGIFDAAAALAGRMKTPRESKALVTFSGHGSWDEKRHAMLVPADGAKNTKRRIALDDFLDTLDKRAPSTDVTLFIDACHVSRGDDEPRAMARAVAGDAVPATARLCMMRRGGDVMLTAAQPQELTYEIEVGGEHRGAFSWAMTALLDRWGVRSPGKDPDFDIAYADLLDRAQQLLVAMEVAQPPQYSGPAWARQRAVLSSRLADAPDGVPDADVQVREVNPLTGWYQIETSAGADAGGVTVSSSEMVWTWDLDKVAAPFPAGVSFQLIKQSGTFTPPTNKIVQTFENHNGLKKSSTTLTPTYKVTGSGTSHTYYMQYHNTNGMQWIADTSGNLSGNTLGFDTWSGSSVTKSHYRHDGFK